MPEHARISFRIPDNYSDILALVMQTGGIVDGASVDRAAYDELFAWHVDEIAEVSFAFDDFETADVGLNSFFFLFDRMALPYVAITTAVPAAKREAGVTGVALLNQSGFVEATMSRDLTIPFEASANIQHSLRRIGFRERGLKMMYAAFAPPEREFGASPTV